MYSRTADTKNSTSARDCARSGRNSARHACLRQSNKASGLGDRTRSESKRCLSEACKDARRICATVRHHSLAKPKNNNSQLCHSAGLNILPFEAILAERKLEILQRPCSIAKCCYRTAVDVPLNLVRRSWLGACCGCSLIQELRGEMRPQQKQT